MFQTARFINMGHQSERCRPRQRMERRRCSVAAAVASVGRVPRTTERKWCEVGMVQVFAKSLPRAVAFDLRYSVSRFRRFRPRIRIALTSERVLISWCVATSS